MEDLPIFRERLLLARRRADLSQGELAKRTGMHPSDISKMERGRMLPTAPRLRRLAAALGVSADYLLDLDISEQATSNGSSQHPEQAKSRAKAKAPAGPTKEV